MSGLRRPQQSVLLISVKHGQNNFGVEKGLKCYISMTEGFRKDSNNELLFISSVGLHNLVKSQTISNWIKKVLKDAGFDVEIFSSHSTRGAAASKAVAVGASLDSVLSAGHWASSSTFRKFYHNKKDPGPSVAASVLNPDNNWYSHYLVPTFISPPPVRPIGVAVSGSFFILRLAVIFV